MNLVEKIKTIFFKKTLHHTAFVTAGSLVNGLSLFALNILLARALSQDLFGIFSLAVLVLIIMGEISDFGLNSGLLRFAPLYISTKQTEKLKQLVKTVWGWRVALSAILTVGCIVFAFPISKYIFGQEKLTPYLSFSSLGVGGAILLGFVITFLQAEQKFLRQAVIQSLKGFSRLVIIGILYLLGVKNLSIYLAVYVAVPWFLFVFNYRQLPAEFRKVKIEAEVKQKLHSQLANFSFWLTIWSLVSIAAGKVDQIMVSHYLGLEQVAVFTVAWQFIQFFPVFYGSINAVLVPKISSLTSKAELRSFVARTFKWVLMAAIGVAVVIYPSQFLITLLFGQKYAASMPVFLVLSFAMLFNVLAIPFSLAVTAFNRTKIVAMSGVIQMFIMVICNLLFIPRFGIIGSAYTFTIGMIVQFAWNFVWSAYLLEKTEFKVV